MVEEQVRGKKNFPTIADISLIVSDLPVASKNKMEINRSESMTVANFELHSYKRSRDR